MTPEHLKALFDANAIVLMFVAGLAIKYIPALKAIPNLVIPWVNVIGYVLVHLFTPDAHASVGDVAQSAGLVLSILAGFTNAVWARQLYEGFIRGLIHRPTKEASNGS